MSLDRLWGITAPDALDLDAGPFAAVRGEPSEAYLGRMRALYRADRALFDALLARPTVRLCSDEQIGTLFAGILSKLGATCTGNVAVRKTAKCSFQWCYNEGCREACCLCFACWRLLSGDLRRKLARARASCPEAHFTGATTPLYNAALDEAFIVLRSKLP